MIKRADKIGTTGYAHYMTDGKNYVPSRNDGMVPTLPPAIYQVDQLQNGELIFRPQPAASDKLINLPNTASDLVLAEINQFWEAKTKEKFDRYGLVYKRGVLLYGDPGTGKTCTIAQVMDKVVNEGGIVLFNPHPQLVVLAAERIREIQPGMKMLIVWEEFDNLVNQSSFLSLLDGQLQLDNVLYIATTNYIDRIPVRVRNRPSRFATVIEIGKPDADTRLAYLKYKLLPEDQQDLNKWVEVSNGMVIDQIKDLIVSVCCFDRSLDEAAKKIHEMNEIVSSEEDEDEEEDDDDGFAII